MRGYTPSARRRRTLSLNSATKTLLGFFDEHLHGLLGYGNPLAACEGRIGLVQHREDFEPSAFALFPQRESFLHRFFLAAKPATLDGPLNEGALVGSQLDFHRFRIHPAATVELGRTCGDRTRGREYTLRGSETRTLSTVGAFRVVPARDLRDHFDRPADPRDGDLRHLREQGLIDTVRLDGRRDVAVVLTDRGRDLLESNRDRGHDPRQEFYAGLKRERELEHDAQVYDAYLSVAERLAERDAHIERVLLDYELKREYQQ